MSRLLSMLLAALLGLFGLTDCTGPSGTEDGPPGPPPTAVVKGTPIAAWDESWHTDLGDIPGVPVGAALLATPQERDDLLAGFPERYDLSEVRAVDLDESVLVVGGYYSCQEQGAAYADHTGAVWFQVTVPSSTEHTDCAWSPFTVEFWEVPWGYPAGEPRLVDPPGSD